MKKVDQIIVDRGRGDCFRACVVSIMELDINSVPNFIEQELNWFQYFWDFLNEKGYEYMGCGFPVSDDKPKGHVLSETINIDGYVIGTVNSRTFDDITHSVVIDLNGKVVHDPNPNKLWQDVNVLESGDLIHWMMIGVEEKNE